MIKRMWFLRWSPLCADCHWDDDNNNDDSTDNPNHKANQQPNQNEQGNDSMQDHTQQCDKDEYSTVDNDTLLQELQGTYDDQPLDGSDAKTRPHGITTLVHVSQKETWDCGVACLQMVLRWLRDTHKRNGSDNDNDNGSDSTDPNSLESLEEKERQWMLDSIGTESIWSIDLVAMLRKVMLAEPTTIQASYVLCSKVLEVDQDHHNLGYYQKAFRKDEIRVNDLFQEARQEEWPLLRTDHFPLDRLLTLLSRPDTVAIALVDSSILAGKEKRGYAGHYIVLVGTTTTATTVAKKSPCNNHDDDDDDAVEHQDNESNNTIVDNGTRIVAHNPARSCRHALEYLTPEKFEKAWRAQGTDEDILFVRRGK